MQTRRLEAAHARLALAATHEHVASVGYAFGFASDAHFNKAFRRRFGFTPGEARRRVERALREGDATSAGALYRAWVKSLAQH